MNKTRIELDLLYSAAQKDITLKKNLLATRFATDPMAEFCKLAGEAGYAITVGELFALGQEYSDNQCKSTNGGNPNPFDSFEDAYDGFLDSL